MIRHASLGLGLVLGLACAVPVMAQGPKHEGHGPTRLPGGRLCQKCIDKLPKRVAAEGPVEYVVADEAPGVAHVGAAGPRYAAVAGYAGDPTGPMPVGMMGPGHPAMGGRPPMAAAPVAAMRTPEIPAPELGNMGGPGLTRQRFLGSLLGVPKMSSIGAAKRAREREAHAMTRYDESVSRVSSLPRSVVGGH
jgi:hypothetical protein